MIYLDYNATSPLRPSVVGAIEALGDLPLNPSSVHKSGRAAKKIIEDARIALAQHLSCFANEILWVGSGTEANNMVLRGFAPTHTLLVGATEHASVRTTAERLGAAVLPVDEQGIIEPAGLHRMLAALGGAPALVSMMLVNNESGVIQPIAELAAITRQHGALLHCDAVQAFGKVPLDFGLLGVDMLTLCAHKVGGPVGVGALVIRNDLPIAPMFIGGGQELGRRGGTENVRAIAAMRALIEDFASDFDAPKLHAWRAQLESELRVVCPSLRIAGERTPRVANTVQLTMPGVSSETQLMHFDLAGIAVSAGSACSSGRIDASHVLRAMGWGIDEAREALRISMGWNTKQADIDACIAAWKTLAMRTGKTAA